MGEAAEDPPSPPHCSRTVSSAAGDPRARGRRESAPGDGRLECLTSTPRANKHVRAHMEHPGERTSPPSSPGPHRIVATLRHRRRPCSAHNSSARAIAAVHRMIGRLKPSTSRASEPSAAIVKPAPPPSSRRGSWMGCSPTVRSRARTRAHQGSSEAHPRRARWRGEAARASRPR